MKTYAIFTLKCFIFIFLSGCNLTRIETTFDENKRANVCSLKNNEILSGSTFMMMTWYKLELDLDTVDSNTVMAKFTLNSFGNDLIFRQYPLVVFKIINNNRVIDEIKIKCTEALSHQQAYGRNQKTQFIIPMTRDQIIEITRAEKVALCIETIDKPLQGLIDKDKLQPIKNFVLVCLTKK